MNSKHRKQARVAMTIALTATSIAHSTSSILAQGESTIEEHIPINDTEEKVEAVENTVEDIVEDPVEDTAEDSSDREESVEYVERAVGDVEINEVNFPDSLFREYISTNFDTNGDGILSNDEINNVTKIELYSFPSYYRISNLSGIEHFPNLTKLECGNTLITELDVSNNPALEYLNCYGTKITNLDLSNNPALKDLTCYVINTLHSLDLSNNPALTWLHISPNNFAWLNIGNISNYITITTNTSTVNLGGISDTFNIKERFPGIDVSKIMNINGANLDPSTGVVSGYTFGTPITYTYDCGTRSNGVAVTLDVTMNFKGISSIIINNDLNKVYNGQAVINPTDIVTTGSTGNVKIEWYRADGIRLGSAPVNAGRYKVKAILAEDASYVGAEVEKEFEITKDISTITIHDDLNKVYDGQLVSYPINVRTTGSYGRVSYKWYTADGVELGSAPTEVGNYKVKAILEGDMNYEGTEVEKEFAITKANSTITIYDGLNKVYDGQPVTYPINIGTTGSTGTVNIQWYTADGVELSSAPTEVGNYKVKAVLEADANHDGIEVEKQFTITKATSTIIINDNLNKVYDGTVIENPIDVLTTGSTGTVSYQWYTADGMELGSAPSEAGNYKVKALLAEDGNHEGAEVEKDFTITKATSTVTIHDELNKVYDGQAVVEPTNITKTGSTGTVSVQWYTLDGMELGSAPTEAGSYKVKAILEGDVNYDSVEAEKSFTISKATSAITINDDLNKAYDGQAVIEPTNITTTGSSGTVSVQWYTADGVELGSAPSEVGSYKVKVILAGDGNYDGVEVEKSFTISKGISAIIIHDELNKVYDGQAVIDPANIATTGSSGSVSVQWYTADGSQLQAAPVDAGSYKVKVILSEDANFDSVEVEKEFAISKATSTIIIYDELNKVYDGQAVIEPSITKTGSTGSIVYEWYVKDNGVTRNTTWTKLAAAPSEVGSYKLVVTVGEDSNYNGATTEVVFMIKEAQPNNSPVIEDTNNGSESNNKEEVNESTGNQVSGVQTGDITKVGLWTLLIGLSIGLMLFFIKKNRKED